MEQILEIRDGCSTSEQLFKSYAFSRYIRLYKDECIHELSDRSGVSEHEAKQRVAFIKDLSARDFIAVLSRNGQAEGDVLERDRTLVRFLDGAFHHFRKGNGYSRLVRLQNEVMTGDETLETVKDKVTEKAQKLSNLLMDTRRELMTKAGVDYGVRRTYGTEPTPNVTAGEISGHYLNLPGNYVGLSHVPLTIAADIQTGIDYRTPSNKRALPFYELDHNPLNLDNFDPQDWVSVPLRVGSFLIVAYIHKSRGCIEMEPGLLNLFPFATTEDITSNRQPDGIFVFGDPSARDEDLGYYYDVDNDLLVGMVPNRDELKYFGYCKKPILTLHNVRAIQSGELPLHCGCTRYVMQFDKETGDPYIADMIIKADDMGRARLEEGADGITRPIFYGTETGAFACLDGFSEAAKLQMQGREVGYNKDKGSNARQVVPVSNDAEMLRGDALDVLLYANNFTLVDVGAQTIHCDMAVDEAIEAFRLGERVAAGSTQTGRGSKEISYWANPFPALKDNDGELLHPALYEQFSITESRFIGIVKQLVGLGQMSIGVAYSQLMAGAYKDNDDEDIRRCGYDSREEVEMNGPVHLASDLIELVKKHAVKKRERLGGQVNEVDITVALVGDSRTGKSETAEKMEGILNLQMI